MRIENFKATSIGQIKPANHVSASVLEKAKAALFAQRGDLDEDRYSDHSGRLAYHVSIQGDSGFELAVTYDSTDIAYNYRTKDQAWVRLSEMVAAVCREEIHNMPTQARKIKSHWRFQELLAAFQEEMVLSLGDNLLEVIDRNAAEADSSICHSHDFIDANECMLAAMEECRIRFRFDPEDEIQAQLTSDVWSAAKKNNFGIEAIPCDLPPSEHSKACQLRNHDNAL
jgi:hypothetical protein